MDSGSGSRISGKGVRMFKGKGHFAFLKYRVSHENEIICGEQIILFS